MDRLEHPTVIAGTLEVDRSVYGQFTVNVGGNRSLVLDMGSVGHAKQQMVRKTGMPTHLLHVWHAGKELLDDSAHVMSYGVEDGSHLQLLIPGLGGVPPDCLQDAEEKHCALLIGEISVLTGTPQIYCASCFWKRSKHLRSSVPAQAQVMVSLVLLFTGIAALPLVSVSALVCDAEVYITALFCADALTSPTLDDYYDPDYAFDDAYLEAACSYAQQKMTCLTDCTADDALGPIYAECNSIYIDLMCSELNVDNCDTNPCVHGTCTDLGLIDLLSFDLIYSCACESGYEGSECDIDIDDCSSSPCSEQSTCVDLVNDFSCECASGWTGSLCDVDIDDCAVDPCLHGSCADNGPNNFTCTCNEGFEGVICDTDIDDCDVDPCLQGSCADNGPNSFTCTCNEGFEGVICDTDIDDCLSSPCLNNQSCVDYGVNSAVCECSGSFTGDNCELSACDPNPCTDDSECVFDVEGSFAYCECDVSALSMYELAVIDEYCTIDPTTIEDLTKEDEYAGAASSTSPSIVVTIGLLLAYQHLHVL